MTDIYNHNAKEYIEKCPMCDSTNIKKGKENWNGKRFSQMFKCKNCGYKWAIDVSIKRIKENE